MWVKCMYVVIVWQRYLSAHPHHTYAAIGYTLAHAHCVFHNTKLGSFVLCDLRNLEVSYYGIRNILCAAFGSRLYGYMSCYSSCGLCPKLPSPGSAASFSKMYQPFGSWGTKWVTAAAGDGGNGRGGGDGRGAGDTGKEAPQKRAG